VIGSNVAIRQTHDETVMSLSGELDLATVHQLEWALADARASGRTRIVLDCADLEFFDCSVLGALARHLQLAADAALVFRAPSPFVVRVLGLVEWSHLVEPDGPGRGGASYAASPAACRGAAGGGSEG
jgi:anti-sigma B factor antagonist